MSNQTCTRLECLGMACLFLVFGCEPGDGGQTSEPVPEPRVPALYLGMTVEAAYASIPSRRTKLDLRESCIDPGVRWYVEAVFACIDEAIVLRVVTLNEYLQGKYAFRTYSLRCSRIYDFLVSLAPPDQLRTYHEKILEALEAQHSFFAAWTEAGASFPGAENAPSHPDVKRCSDALQEACRIISEAIGPDAVDQREAFQDYHRALDFGSPFIR